MDDDLAKKQRPSDDDGSSVNDSQDKNDEFGLKEHDFEHEEEEDVNKQKEDDNGSDKTGTGAGTGNSQDKNDEFGLEEYGYDLEFGEKEGTDKQKKREEEESEEEKDAKSRKEDEEYRKRIQELEELRKMREEKRKKDLGKMKEKDEKKEREREKKEKQWEETDEKQEEQKQKQKLIAGEKVERKRVFTHKKEEGVFRHKKLFNFSTKGVKKIDKRFRKVHGISSEKKRKFIKLLEAYNPSKSVLTRKKFNDFSRRFKSKRFTGLDFDRMVKEGIDLRSARKEFGKRDLDKLRRGITGEKDPHKYQRKSSSRKSSGSKSSGSGATTRTR